MAYVKLKTLVSCVLQAHTIDTYNILIKVEFL